MRPILRSAPAMASASFVAVVLADLLLWDQPVGWTAGLLLVAALSLVLARHPAALRSPHGLPSAALVLAMAVSCVWEPSTLAILLACGGLIGTAMAGRAAWDRAGAATMRWLGCVCLAVPRLLGGPWRDLRLMGWRRGGSRAMRGLMRWAIPIVLLLVFVALFRSANPLIDAWAGVALEWLLDACGSLPDPARAGLWLLSGGAAWGLIRLRWSLEPGTTRRLRAAASDRPDPDVRRFWEMVSDPGFAVRCLVLFNAMFVLHNLLDLRYLWAGSALPDGLTHAAYAHRGAYPLVATALLAGLFVLTVFRAGGAAEASPWARRLVVLWLVQNLVLLGGSLWRLHLYVASYDLTLLRLAAGVWMGLVGGGLALAAWRLLRRLPNAWLLDATALLVLGTLAVVAWCDCRGAVAWYNVRHCRQVDGGGSPLDLAYLEELGPASIPALRWCASGPADAGTRAAANDLAGRLAADQPSGWRAWTLRGADR